MERFEQGIAQGRSISGAITGWENRWNTRNLVATSRPDYVSQRSQDIVANAEKWTPEDYRAAVLQREEIRARHAALAPLVDAMIAPASPGVAPLWSPDVPGQPLTKRPTGDAVYNTPSSALGAPVVTSPMTSVGGMPMGIQLIGQPAFANTAMTAIARWMVETIEPAIA